MTLITMAITTDANATDSKLQSNPPISKIRLTNAMVKRNRKIIIPAIIFFISFFIFLPPPPQLEIFWLS